MNTSNRQSKGRAGQQGKAWRNRVNLQRKWLGESTALKFVPSLCEMLQTPVTPTILWPAHGVSHPSFTHQGMQHLCPCLQSSVVTHTGKEKPPWSHQGVMGRNCCQPASLSPQAVLSGWPSLGSNGSLPHLQKQLLSPPLLVGMQCKHNYVYCLFRKK